MQIGYALPGAASKRFSSILTSCRQGMFKSYSYVNRALFRSFSAARVTSGGEADTSHEP